MASTRSVTPKLAILGGERSVPEGAYGRWPDITQADRDAVMSVLDRGILTGGGSVEAPGFATEYGAYVGAQHCLAFNSGTAALHACAVAARLEPGDEIIVPAFTYVASAMAFALHGVRPVFADVELDTYLLDPTKIEAKLSNRTKAILAVHLHGLPCDMDVLAQIAARHGLLLIEDISQAHGSAYKGKTVGTFGYCAGGSLNATKNLPGGEGGMFLTDDDEAVVRAQRLRYLGEDPLEDDPPLGRRYWSHGLGFNYRPQELPFAFARSQLRRLTGYNEIAQRNATILTEGIKDISSIVPPIVPKDRQSVWYMYRVRLDCERLGLSDRRTDVRDRIMAALNAEGVHVMMWQHHALPAFTAFRHKDVVAWNGLSNRDTITPWQPDEFPISTQVARETFILGSGSTPLAAQSEELVTSYVNAIRKVMAQLDDVLSMDFSRPADSIAADLYDDSSGQQGEPKTIFPRRSPQ